MSSRLVSPHNDDLERALNTVLGHPENKALIEQHLGGLAEQTLASRTAFESIGKLLASFDKGKYRNNGGGAVPALHPGWESLRKRYNELLRNSHRDATTIKGICDWYIEAILSPLEKPDASIDAMKAHLKKFLESSEKSENRASSSATSLDKFRSDVESYKRNIEEALGSIDADPSLLDLQRSISEVKGKIADTQQSIVRSGTLATRALLAWCPSLLDMLAPQVDSPKLSSLKALQSQLRHEEGELTRLRPWQGRLGTFTSEFQASESAFHALTAHFGMLANFWAAVRADCQGAIQRLNKAETMETVSQVGLKEALDSHLAGSIYITLSKALGVYISQMTRL